MLTMARPASPVAKNASAAGSASEVAISSRVWVGLAVLEANAPGRRGSTVANDQRVTANPPRTSRPKSRGEKGRATTSGGTARTAQSSQSQTQVVLSTATAGGNNSSSIQFKRFKLGPVLRNEIYRNIFWQGHTGRPVGLANDD